MSRDLTGKTLGGYRFGETLAKGEHSTVYAANQTQAETGDEKPCTVRVFLDELPKDKAACDRIVREVERATKVSHKNLVSVWEVGTIEVKSKRYLLIATEPLGGQSLKARLATQPGHALPVHVALQVASTVGGALQAIHAQGISHRRVSSGSVFFVEPTDAERKVDFEAEDRICLVDLGTATFLDALSSASNGPKNGNRKPEKISDDLHGLASLIVETLGGVPTDPLQGARAVLPLRFRDSRIPAHIEAVLQKAMSVANASDEKPFDSIGVFVAALFGDVSHVPTIAAWSTDGSEQWVPPQKGSGLFWPAILSVVAALGFGLGYWLLDEPTNQQTALPDLASGRQQPESDRNHKDAGPPKDAHARSEVK